MAVIQKPLLFLSTISIKVSIDIIRGWNVRKMKEGSKC